MGKTTIQAYVRGSVESVELYKRAFNTDLSECYKNDDGTYAHAEFDIYGQAFAVSESWFGEVIKGNTMQFILHFGESREAAVIRAYEVLGDGADILFPLGPSGWSALMFGLIDKFGVCWCVAV